MKHHIVYLFLHLPCIWRVKVGITGRTASHRAKQVSRAMPGVAIPIGIMFLPFFAKVVEQAFHSLFSGLQLRFYKGDGSTEWFFVLAAIPFYILMYFHFVAWMWFAEWVVSKI